MHRKFLILSLFLLAGCNSQGPVAVKEPVAVPVIVASASVKDVTFSLEFMGTLQFSEHLDISPQVSGRLTEVLVKEGQIVKIGDPLFKIDPLLYEIKVQEAKAQLDSDAADLYALSQKLKRFEDLGKRDLVAKTEVEDLSAKVQKALAAIDLSQGKLQSAELELHYCTIKSPLSGRVGKLDVIPGKQMTPTTSLASISKTDPLILEFLVTENEFPLIPKENSPLTICPLCASSFGQDISGTITYRDHHFDKETGLLLIRGRVSNPELTLRPGQSVKVHIPIAVNQNALLIPQKAIRYNSQGPYVYVVNEDLTVTSKEIALGTEEGHDQIVLEGLDLNDRFIVEGHLRLRPGLKVDIKS